MDHKESCQFLLSIHVCNYGVFLFKLAGNCGPDQIRPDSIHWQADEENQIHLDQLHDAFDGFSSVGLNRSDSPRSVVIHSSEMSSVCSYEIKLSCEVTQ